MGVLVPSWAGFGVFFRKAAEHVFLYDGKSCPKTSAKIMKVKKQKFNFDDCFENMILQNVLRQLCSLNVVEKFNSSHARVIEIKKIFFPVTIIWLVAKRLSSAPGFGSARAPGLVVLVRLAGSAQPARLRLSTQLAVVVTCRTGCG